MSVQKIKQSIHANAQEYLISDIGEDSEVFEVQLKHPYVNYDDESTIWVYAKENLTLDGGSIDNMLEDLQCWLSYAEVAPRDVVKKGIPPIVHSRGVQ